MQKFLRTLTLMALLVVPWVTQAQQTLPYSYGFEDNDLTTGGWLLQNATSSSTGISSSAAQSGSYGFQFRYSESNDATLISPVLNGTTNGVTVSFSYKESSSDYGDEQFYVGYTTDETVTDPDDFIYGSIITASLSWQQYENTFPAGTKRIAVKYVYNNALFLYLDDFTFEAPSSCVKPSVISITGATSSSISISWVPAGSETSWNVYLDGVQQTTTTTTTYTYPNLTLNSDYTLGVSAVCGSDESAQKTTTFHLGYCTPNPTSVDGDGISNVTFGLSPVVNDNLDMTCYSTTYSDASCLYQDHSNLIGGSYPGGTINMSIAYATNYSYYTWVWVDWNNDFTFSESETVYAATSTISSGTLELSFDIPTTAALGDYRMRIMGKDGTTNNPCYSGSYAYLVDYTLRVGEAPSCMPVTALNGSAAGTTVTLTWTDEGNTGASYTVMEGETLLSSNATSPFVINGATLGDHTYSVIANCTGDATASPVTTNVHVGYCVPSPSSVDGSGITSLSFGSMTNTTHLGSTAGYADYSSMSGSVPAGTTASVDIAYGHQYDYGTIIWVDWNSDMTFSGDEVVFAGQSPGGSSSTNYFTATFDIPVTQALGSYRMRILASDDYFDSYTGSLSAAADANPCASYSWGVAEDYTLTVTPPPTCYMPVSFEYDNVTTNGATLSWTRDTRNADGETYSILDENDQVVTGAENISGTSFQLTGLDEYTEYTFKVRTNCANPSENVEALTVTFTTLAGCQAVQNIAASNVTATGLTLTWTDPNSGSNTYTITKNGEVVTSTCGETSYTFNDLTAQTSYTFTVAVNCASATSVEESLAITTPCEAISTFPITYGFETSEGFSGSTSSYTTNTLGDCWRNEATVQNGNYTTRLWSVNSSASYVHTGSQSLKLADKGTSSAVSKTMLVFPPMNFTNANGYIVSFWIQRSATGTNPEGFIVYASNSDTIDANAVQLGHYSRNYGIAYPKVESASGWYQYETEPITLTGNVYLIFEGQSYYGNATYVDDIEIKLAPSCFKVSDLSVDGTQTTTSSLTLTWNDNHNTGATYTIYNIDDNSVIESGVATTTYTVTGLTDNTPYTFGVVANCSPEDASEVATVNGRTACAAISSLPVTWTFEADELMTTSNSVATPALPWCSYRYVTPSATSGTTYPYSYSNITYVHEGSRSLYFYGTTSTSYPAQMAWIMPEVDVTNYPMNGNRVTFYARSSSASYDKVVHVGTMTDPTDWSTFTEVTTVTVTGITHTLYKASLAAATATDAYVALMVDRGSGSLYIDDVTLEQIPTVLSVEASNITATSVDLDWTVFRTCDGVSYTVTYGAESATVSGTSTTIENLTPNTNYTFTVSSSCAAANEEAPSVSFTTLQIPATVPYATGFEATDDNNMWTLANDANGWYIGTGATEEGNTLYISNDGGLSNAYTNSGAVSWSYAYRLLDFSEAGWYKFNFDWIANGESTWDYLRAWLAPSSVTPVTGASPVGTTSTTGYNATTPEGWIDLNPDNGKLNLVTSWQSLESVKEVAAPGTYTLVLMWANDNSGGDQPPAAVDNISIMRNAFEPIDLTAENITATGATLTWTRDKRNGQTAGANDETYNVLLNGMVVNAEPISGTSYDVTLTANTDYSFSVYAVNHTDQSDAENVSLRVNEYPTVDGRMVNLGYSYDWTAVAANPSASFYYGMGATRADEAAETLTATTGEGSFTNTTSSDWVNDGPVTVVFLNHNANAINFTTENTGYDCPTYILDRDPVTPEAQNGSYTWTTPEGVEYPFTNYSETALAADMNISIDDTVKNAGLCDSIYNHFVLTLHPSYSIDIEAEICERDIYTVGAGRPDSVDFTATGNYTVNLTSQYGADSVINLALQVHTAPLAYIYYNNRNVTTVDNFCDGFNMNLEARSNVAGATFEWEDNTTEANRVVNPSGSNSYTLVATDPSYSCTSVPVTLTVTTTPVPELTVEGVNTICVGNSTTLSVTDANAISGVTFRWYNATTNAVAGVGATLTVSPTETTAYYVTAEGDCPVTSDPYTVTVNPLPVVEVSTSANVLCYGDPLTISATEGFAAYEWNIGANAATTTIAAATTGAYTVTVTDVNGCVSEKTTPTVTVNPVYELNDEMSVCYLQNPYTWGAQTLTADGNYDQTFQTVNNCDSLVHLTFTFQQMGVENSYREVCQNTDVVWGATTYPAVQESATLTYVLNAGDVDPNNVVLECPVTYNLFLTVNPVKASSFEQVACDSYDWTVSGETYTTTGAYPYTLQTTKGCDSVVTMNLTVNYQNTGVDTQVACDSYEWIDGNIYTASNSTATHTLAGANAYGCDSTVTLNLTVNYKNYEEYFHRECGSKTYTWLDGITYNLSVDPSENITYTYPGITNVDGCDSIAILHLVMNPVVDTLKWVNITVCDEYLIDTVACDGTVAQMSIHNSGDYELRTRNTTTGRDQWSRIHLTVNTSEYHTSIVEACVPYTWTVNSFEIGTYEPTANDTVVTYAMDGQYTANGCNNIEVLRLKAKRATSSAFTAYVCDANTNGTYNWYSGTALVGSYSAADAGTIEHTFTGANAAGCDSVVTMTLVVNQRSTGVDEAVACDTYTWTRNSMEYTASTNEPSVTLAGADANGCDSIVTLNLTVNNSNTGVDVQKACDSYTWIDGETYTASNDVATYTLTNAANCDSVVTLNLTMGYSNTGADNVEGCYTYNYIYNGETLASYTESGTYTVTLAGANADQCDSVVTLTVTVLDTVRGYATIDVCETYTYNGQTYTENRTFREESGSSSNGCDSVTYITYNVLQPELVDLYVVTNVPYTWLNGQTYDHSVSSSDGVYWDVTGSRVCDSVVRLNLTWVDNTIDICENSLPYATSYGFEITAVGMNQTYSNNDVNGNDTIIVYNVKTNVSSSIAETACDSYTWTDGNNQTYIESGSYPYVIENGADNSCDSIVTLNLTINNHQDSEVAATACDTYTWTVGDATIGTYTESGNYTRDIIDANGCDATETLVLTINNHQDSEVEATACDTYTWADNNDAVYTESGNYTRDITDANNCAATETLVLTINNHQDNEVEATACDTYTWADNGNAEYTTSGSYTRDITDANGCAATETLVLTINNSVVVDIDSIVNAASTIFDEVLYQAPWKETFTYNGTNIYGCDSVTNITLKLNNGKVGNDSINACGYYVWRNGHRYEWIPESERTNPIFHYKDVTANEYINEVPTYSTYHADGTIDITYVLWLALLEAHFENVTVARFPLSQGTLTVGNDTLGYETLDFSAYTADETVTREVHHNSTYYCSNIYTYTVNLVWNYDTLAPVTVCYGVDNYELNGIHHALNVGENVITEVFNAGTADEQVTTVYVTRLADPTSSTTLAEAVCDSYNWTDASHNFDTVITTTGSYSHTFTDVNGCDSTATLSLTVNYNSNQGYTNVACDSYVWVNNGWDTTITASGNYMHAYTNADGCPSVDTLHLTVNYNSNTLFNVSECDSYTWVATDNTTVGTYSASTELQYPYMNPANNCPSVDTLRLTIRNSSIGDTTAVKCDNFTWHDVTYTASTETPTFVYTNGAGCDSTVTLHLTINTNEGTSETVVECDSYAWQYMAEPLTASNTYSVNYTDANGCEGTHVLNLTINTNEGTSETVTECDSYTWQYKTEPLTATNTYSVNYTDANGCVGAHKLNLTINESKVTTEYINEIGSSYRFHNVLYVAPIVDSLVPIHYTTTAGCDSLVNYYLTVTPYNYTYVNQIACGLYTWPVNGHTYQYISDEASAANGNALYYDMTADAYVTSEPRVTDANGTDVTILNLTLNEAIFTNATIDFPLSNGTLALTDKSYDFTSYRDSHTEVTVYDTVYLGSNYYCDSIVFRTINLHNNYDTLQNVYLCNSETNYTFNGVNYTLSVGDNEITETFNAGTADVRVKTVTVVRMAAMTDDTTAVECDSFDWYEHQNLTTSGDYTHTFQVTKNDVACDSVLTLHLTINSSNSVAKTDAICFGTGYTGYDFTVAAADLATAGDYTFTHTTTNAAGCDSVTTLTLTVNPIRTRAAAAAICLGNGYAGNGFDIAAADLTTVGENVFENETEDANGCDSLVTLTLTVNPLLDTNLTDAICFGNDYTANGFNIDAADLTTPGTYERTRNTNSVVTGCDSTVNLTLTVNPVFTTALSESVCLGNGYTENGFNIAAADIATPGTYNFTLNTNTVVTGCDSTVNLTLTVNAQSYYDSVIYASYGSYRYNGTLLGVGDYEHYDSVSSGLLNSVNCDSIYDISIHVGTAYYYTEEANACYRYTWRDGNTYRWISDEESAANNNAIYFNETTGEYVLYRPTWTVEQHHDYDSVYTLLLNLMENYTATDVATVNVSAKTFTYGNETFTFAEENDSAYNVLGYNGHTIVRDVHFNGSYYCDSIITLTLNVVNNYVEAETADICADNASYAWRGQTVSTATTDYDHPHTYRIYDTLTNGTIEYITVNQHPFSYVSAIRTACDSYTWEDGNGQTYTSSTSAPTVTLHDQYQCDSVVTLVLTINKNNGFAETVTGVCDSYDWNGHVYTEGGVKTVTYTDANGCVGDSVLTLTIGYTTNNASTEVACDSYEWHGTPYTTTGTYTYPYDNADGCASVDTLHLTVNHNSSTGYIEAACDSYEWSNNGNVNTYTESGTYYSSYNTADGCASVDTLYLTINTNPGFAETITGQCDSYDWNGHVYTESGEHHVTFTDDNGCVADSVLTLTIGYTTNNAYTEAACHNYEWNGTTYSTTGTYTYPYINADGCASVDTLHLTIGTMRVFDEQVVDNCGPYTWIVNGTTVGTYTADTNTTVTLPNSLTGCDSVVFLRLTVRNIPETFETETLCESQLASYTWNGMTFNGSTPDAIYTATAANGCDSLVHMALTVNPTLTSAISDAICLGNGYTENGFSIAADDLATAGVYTFTLNTSSAITNCDSIVTLTLTVGETLANAMTVTECDNYTWNGTDYTVSGDYTYEYADANGCLNVDTLHLTINANSGHATTVAYCDNYQWNGETYNQSGDYYYSYTDGNNCTSVDTLHLTIANSIENTFEQTACDSYTWTAVDGTEVDTYTESGTYTYNYSTADGCTGIETLVLTINNSSSAIDEQTACDSYEWIDGVTYTATTNEPTVTLTNAAGCDSVVTLHLTINNTVNETLTVEACNYYNWHGETYTETTTEPTYTTTGANGCDSVTTLNLTINLPTASQETAVACVSYDWNGTTYTQSGNYLFHSTNVAGCDSTATLNLTINQPVATAVSETVCGTDYTWNGETYTESGVYTYTTEAANGCDSVVTLTLVINEPVDATLAVTACDSYEWNGNVYAQSGSYTRDITDANGCAATETLVLTITESSASEANAIACNSYEWNGNVYTASGDYTYTTTGANGCDSTATLHLTVNYNTNTKQTVVACDNYEWNGTNYNASGVYTFNYVAANNCPSTDTLALTLNETKTSSFDASTCSYYVWNDRAYTTTGSYVQTLSAANGCDSIVTMNLTVNTPVTTAVSATACNSYEWNGQTYTTSGSYTYHATSSVGCDSTVTLTLTINQPVTANVYAEACGSYTWNGQTYITSGDYNYTTTAANNCDSVATLHLTINQPVASTVPVTACDSYTWNGQTYTVSGTYTYTATAANGCDSVVTLNLTINNPVSHNVTETACDSYTWNGQTYTVSGIYTYTATAANGCDSIVTLNLTVNPATTENVYAEACSNYTWNGQTYNQSGVYTYHTTNANGCDSTVTLLLNISQAAIVTINQTACDSYTWTGATGATYTTSGEYTYNTTTVNGCDSTVTLNLTINNSASTSVSETACSSYSWNGTEYTTSGTYTQNFVAANGCDSTVTLTLTVNMPVEVALTETACSSYEWNGTEYTTSGTYTYTTTAANGCDSVTTLTLTINQPVYVNIEASVEGSYNWNGNVYTESGVYTYTTEAANGCDSVTTLTLTVTPVYTVTLVSSNSAWGTVSESGTIAENGYFTATATANEGYEFVAWMDGSDTVSHNATYVFQVTGDITLTAVFAEKQPIGIEDVDATDVTIFSVDNKIVVNGAVNQNVYIYDVNGRCVRREANASETMEFTMTVSGVYLVKVGNAPAKRVVVLR